MDWQNVELHDCVHHENIHIRRNDYDAGDCDVDVDADFLIDTLHVLPVNLDDWCCQSDYYY
jgi:hypothetical protein